jgi:hypothetical protein
VCSLPEAWAMLPEEVADACDDLDRMADLEAHTRRNLIKRDT